jgi:hypothetical protein
MTENCKLRKAILSAFYDILQRNFGILLILWCSFKLWWNFSCRLDEFKILVNWGMVHCYPCYIYSWFHETLATPIARLVGNLGTINTRSSCWLETGQSNSKVSHQIIEIHYEIPNQVRKSKFPNCKRFWR